MMQKACLFITVLMAPTAYAHKGHGLDALPAELHGLLGHGELLGLLAISLLLLTYVAWRSGKFTAK